MLQRAALRQAAASTQLIPSIDLARCTRPPARYDYFLGNTTNRTALNTSSSYASSVDNK